MSVFRAMSGAVGPSAASALPHQLRGPDRFLPKSTALHNAVRQLISTVAPNLRQRFPLPLLDGPLAAEAPNPDGGPLLHGKRLPADPFAYMENLHDRKTLDYAKREQRHLRLLDEKLSLQSTKMRIWGEQDARILYTTREGGYDAGEERIGNYLYLTRELTNSGEVGFYRKKFGEVDLLGEELINPDKVKNEFGYAVCKVGICRVSADGEFLAFTMSIDGSDRYICHVKSINSGAVYHVIEGRNVISLEFGSANRLFFTDVNELNRPCCVKMVDIAPGLPATPVEVYREDDEEYFVDVRKTKSGEFLIITSDSKTQGRCNTLVAPASYPVVPKVLRPFFPRPMFVEIASKRHWGWVEHFDDSFISVTNDKGDNHRVIYTRVEYALRHGLSAEWRELIPCRPDVTITDNDIFDSALVLYEQTDKFERVHQIRAIDLSNGVDAAALEGARDADSVLHLPPLSMITPGLNRNMDQKSMSFVFSSVSAPVKECTFNFRNHLPEKQARLVSPETLYQMRQHERLTPWDYMWPYAQYRDVVTSRDGTDVPITLVHMRDMFTEELTDFDPLSNSPKKCMLFVYGSYGEVPPMHFQVAPYMWLLRRRWTIAFAHVRGGGESPGWHEQGRHRNKPRTVEDFIACCEYLTNNGYTTPGDLVVVGNSAGAVPIGAAMNMRGNSLFGTALLRAPFLDIINTMSDPSLPLTLAERSEWGDPLNNAEDFELLKSYDPYHNVNDRVEYPSMIISASLDDDRVPAWNALKYAAKIRRQRTRNGVDPIACPLIVRVSSTGGHSAWSEQIPVNEELAVLCNQLDFEASGRIPIDMDFGRITTNLANSGSIDEDDAKTTFLKWEHWEQERLDYHKRLTRLDWEPNFRELKGKKEPFFWIPTEEEVEAKVNANMSEKGRRDRYTSTADTEGQKAKDEAAQGQSASNRETGL